MTDAHHRPGCERPGWTTERSRALPAVTIARCRGCGCVELRTATAGVDR